MTGKTCLITGATGAVGPSVVAVLARSGYEVTVLARKAPQEGLFPSGVRIVQGEVNDERSVRESMADVGAVVHMASKLHVNHPDTAQRAEIRRVNVEGTRVLVRAAQDAGIERLVHVSTIAVYGYAKAGVLSEDSVPAPETIYGETKLEAERVVLAACNEAGQPLGVVLRLGAVYGPRIKGNYASLLRALSRHRFVPLGSGENRRTLVHAEDVARAIGLAVSRPEMAGQIYNVTDGQTHRLGEIIDEMSRALGQAPPRLSVPLVAVKAGAALLRAGAGFVGRRSKVADLVGKYLEEVAVDGNRLKDAGFVPEYDLREGWEQTVRELRSKGQL